MAPRSSTFGFLLKLLLLATPLVAAVVYGPEMWRKYAPQIAQAKARMMQHSVPVPDEGGGPGSSSSIAPAVEVGGDGKPVSGPEAVKDSAAANAAAASAAESAEQRLARLEQEHLSHSTVIAPDEAQRTATGEHVRRFLGFGLSVESRPSHATVLVNGREVGETPLVTSVDCAPGAKVSVEVRKGLLAPQRRQTRCRENELVELRVELR